MLKFWTTSNSFIRLKHFSSHIFYCEFSVFGLRTTVEKLKDEDHSRFVQCLKVRLPLGIPI